MTFCYSKRTTGNVINGWCYCCNSILGNLKKHQRLLRLNYDNFRRNIGHYSACNEAWSKAKATA